MRCLSDLTTSDVPWIVVDRIYSENLDQLAACRITDIFEGEVWAVLMRPPNDPEGAFHITLTDFVDWEKRVCIIIDPRTELGAEALVQFCIRVLAVNYFETVFKYAKHVREVGANPTGHMEVLEMPGLAGSWIEHMPARIQRLFAAGRDVYTANGIAAADREAVNMPVNHGPDEPIPIEALL